LLVVGGYLLVVVGPWACRRVGWWLMVVVTLSLPTAGRPIRCGESCRRVCQDKST